MKALNIHVVPLVVTLDGKSYREGLDIEAEDFYELLDASENMPVTSQPSAGDFAEIYRQLAATDPDILSVHMTSGLSGTYASALAGAEMVPEANVTHFDTKTLSAAAGWQVKAAAQAIKSGWMVEKVLELVAALVRQDGERRAGNAERTVVRAHFAGRRHVVAAHARRLPAHLHEFLLVAVDVHVRAPLFGLEGGEHLQELFVQRLHYACVHIRNLSGRVAVYLVMLGFNNMAGGPGDASVLLLFRTGVFFRLAALFLEFFLRFCIELVLAYPFPL